MIRVFIINTNLPFSVYAKFGLHENFQNRDADIIWKI